MKYKQQKASHDGQPLPGDGGVVSLNEGELPVGKAVLRGIVARHIASCGW
jgi:hypothetical protein